MRSHVPLAALLLAAALAPLAPAAADSPLDCAQMEWRAFVACMTEPCMEGQPCYGVDTCSSMMIDWEYCPGYLLCVEVEHVADRCVRDPVACADIGCVAPVWQPVCADGVPDHACWGDDLVCLQLSPSSIPVCGRDPCAPSGCIVVELPELPPAPVCVAGATSPACFDGGLVCVGTPRSVPVCAYPPRVDQVALP